MARRQICFKRSRPFAFALILLGLSLISDVRADEKDHHSTFVIEAAIVKVIDSVKVPAELAGVIAELNYREGEMVQRGEELGRIKSRELSLRLKRARIEDQISRSTAANNIDIRYAQKSLEVTTSRVTRSQKSNQMVPGAVPLSRIQQQELERHRDQLRVEQAQRDQKIADMQVEASATDVDLNKLLVDKTIVVSPIEGMVVGVETKPGEWVEPGNTILKIVRMNRLKVEGFVPAEIASQMKVGDPASARFGQKWLKSQAFPGKVIFINPEANPVNAMVQVWVEIDNSDLKLIPGLKADLDVVYAPK